MPARFGLMTLDKIGFDFQLDGLGLQSSPLPDLGFHNGFKIIVGEESGGWWARIDELAVETMLFPDQDAAFAAAIEFLDGMAARPRARN